MSLDPQTMDLINPQIVDLLKTILAVGGTALTGWLTFKVGRRNAKAVEKTSELEVQLRPMKDINEAWEKLNTPLIEEVARLSKKGNDSDARIESLETALHAVENEQRILVQDYGRALTLLVSFAHWIDNGALPPPPNIPDWLREHMLAAIKRVTTGPQPTVSQIDGPNEGA